ASLRFAQVHMQGFELDCRPVLSTPARHALLWGTSTTAFRYAEVSTDADVSLSRDALDTVLLLQQKVKEEGNNCQPPPHVQCMRQEALSKIYNDGRKENVSTGDARA